MRRKFFCAVAMVSAGRRRGMTHSAGDVFLP